METTPARPAAASPTPAPAQTATASNPASKTSTFAAELKRIASHATAVETLENGAKLYHLAGGREVEAAPGKSPYVVKKGNWPTPSASTTPPATTPAAGTTTTPSTSATTSGSTTSGSTTSGSSTSGSATTSGKATSGSTTSGSTTGSTSGTDQNPPTSQP